MDWDTIRRHSEKVSASFADGRASTAPELHTAKALWDTTALDDVQTDLIMKLSVETSNSPKSYQEDEMGLLQPVYSLVRASPGPNNDDDSNTTKALQEIPREVHTA